MKFYQWGAHLVTVLKRQEGSALVRVVRSDNINLGRDMLASTPYLVEYNGTVTNEEMAIAKGGAIEPKPIYSGVWGE